MNNLMNYGLNDRFILESAQYPHLVVGRVTAQYSELYRVVTEDGEFLASVSGKYEYNAQHLEDFPAVGDFVMIDRSTDADGRGVIHHTLPRKSAFRRTAVGTKGEVQVVASNVDIVFLCMAMNGNFNLRRLERYLSVAWDSGAVPVVLLTKSDLCDNKEELLAMTRSVAQEAAVLITSSKDESACDAVLPYLKNGVTASMIGSSGVGKSTLINKLMGNDSLATFEVRNDDKGRHTTTRRELLVLPHGGIVIDTPGMRELGIDSADLSKTFADIDALMEGCRFSDCSHTVEAGCAILHAIKVGELTVERFESYKKLNAERLYSGLNPKQIEQYKIGRMFGSKNKMKQVKREIKAKNRRHG